MKKILPSFRYVFILLFGLCFFIVKAQDRDSLLNLAKIYVYDNPEKAIEVANSILSSQSLEINTKVQANLVLSNAYSSLRDYNKSLEYALEAKNVSENLKDPLSQYQVMVKIAAQYHSLGVNDKALQILDESDKLIESLPQTETLKFSTGSNYAIRGFIYRDQLSCDIAIDYLNQAYEAFTLETETTASWANKSVTAYNKGNCYLTLNKLDSAKYNFKDAEELAIKAKANSLQAFSLKGLAEVYTLESKYDLAIENLESAHDLAKEVGDLILNRGISKGLSDNYLALKDWSNFQKYDEEYERITSQIIVNERTTINGLLDKYIQENTQNKSQLFKTYGLGILISSLILVGFLVWIAISEFHFQKELRRLKSKIKV